MTTTEAFERVALFKQLRDLAKSGATLDASIVTTFAFNGLYFEEVLLRSFERAGSRLNILLVDAAQLSEALEDPLRRPRRAGTDYLLVPVKGLAAFHPKIVALLSEKRSLLAVGSHNATDAGYGFNNEVTAFWGPGKTPPYLVRDAVDYALVWLESSGVLPPQLLRDIRDRLVSLAGQDAAPANAGTHFIGSTAEQSLWDQLRPHVRGDIQRVWVVGPYFDTGAHLIRELEKQLAPDEIIVAIQPENALVPDPSQFPGSVRFVDVSAAQAFSDYEHAASFLHGKALALEGDGGLVVSLGSANPTGAAWLTREHWNAEANTVFIGGEAVEVFQALGLSQLASSPALSAETLGAIAVRTAEKRRLDDERKREPSPPTLTGESVDGAIKLVGAELESGGAALWYGDSQCVQVRVGALDGGTIVNLDDHRVTSGLHRLERDGKTLAHILVNDAQAIRSATRSRESTRILDRLGSLGTSGDFGDLFDLLGRHVLSTGDQIGAGRSQATSSAQSSDDAPEDRPRGPRGVSLPATEEGVAARRRICDGLIADIISALIKSLTVMRAPTAGPLDGDAPNLDEGDAGDEDAGENVASNLEASGAEPELIDWPRLATACRKKVGTLLRRLEERVKHDVENGLPPSALLGRLVIVAALLQQLRSRPPQTQISLGGRARPASLVSLDQLKILYHLAVRALYEPSFALAQRIESDPATSASQERELLDQLLMWLAREVGADLPRPNARPETSINAAILADLAPVAMSGVCSPAFPHWLAERGPWLAMWDDAVTVDDLWLERVSGFGRLLHDPEALLAAVTTATLEVGSLVYWAPTSGHPWPWVVSSISGRSVSLLGISGELKHVKVGFAKSLDVAALSVVGAAA